MSNLLEIEQQYKDEFFSKLQQDFSRLFARSNPDQTYSKEALLYAFQRIQKEPPAEVLQAYDCLQKHASNPMERAGVIAELKELSSRLSIVHAEFNAFMNELKMAWYPPKTSIDAEGVKENLTEKERELKLESRLAPFKAVGDMIYYLFAHCGKISLSAEQSLLSFERDAFKGV